MTKEKCLRELTELQTAFNETLKGGRNSYAYAITRPRLFNELRQTIAEARRIGITEDDIDEIVLELEIASGRRPIELETLWDPWRISKGWKREQR